MDMTVCIAAIADEGKSLVLAADQMATMPHLVAENEGTHKIFELHKNIYLLTSGDGFNAHKVYNSTIHSKANLTTVGNCVLEVLSAYKRIKQYSAEDHYLSPRGFKDIDDYLSKQNGLDNNVVALIDQQLTDRNFFNEYYIVAGVDSDGLAKAYVIKPPGEFGQINDFIAIGSGQYHASNSLYARGYTISKPENEAVYLTFEAKKRSEIAPGVGKETDMIVISKEKKAKVSSDEDLKKLNTLYKKIVDDEKELLTKNLEDNEKEKNK